MFLLMGRFLIAMTIFLFSMSDTAIRERYMTQHTHPLSVSGRPAQCFTTINKPFSIGCYTVFEVSNKGKDIGTVVEWTWQSCPNTRAQAPIGNCQPDSRFYLTRNDEQTLPLSVDRGGCTSSSACSSPLAETHDQTNLEFRRNWQQNRLGVCGRAIQHQ